jgi:hypothetical protein
MQAHVCAGMTTRELDDIGRAFLEAEGAHSAPQAMYKFPGATCISVSPVIAHGIPDEHVLHEGELIHIDVSAELDGYYADTGASMIVSKSERHLQKLIDTYRSRLIKMDSLLKVHLPAVIYAVPQGGYFFWVRLPESINTTEFRERAKLLNVNFRPGTLFHCEGGLHHFIRLCFAHYDEEQLEQGILRLRECF